MESGAANYNKSLLVWREGPQDRLICNPLVELVACCIQPSRFSTPMKPHYDYTLCFTFTSIFGDINGMLGPVRNRRNANQFPSCSRIVMLTAIVQCHSIASPQLKGFRYWLKAWLKLNTPKPWDDFDEIKFGMRHFKKPFWNQNMQL